MWLIIILVGLVVFFLFILFIPIDLSLCVDVNGTPRFNLKIAWLFRLVVIKIRKDDNKDKGKKPGLKKTRDKKGSAKKAFSILRTRGLFNQVGVLVKGIFRSISIKQLGINFKVGLDDPADTGLLWACMGPALVLFDNPRKYCVRIYPAFEDGAIIEGYAQSELRIFPIKVAFPLLRFIFSPPVFRIAKATAVAKWKR